MAQNQWVIDLESKVLSLVKGKTYNKLKKRYPQIMYTTSSISNDSQRNFPCVYVHELGGSEANSDLERTRINTIVAGFQIEVYSNTSQLDCRTIMAEIMDCIKKLMFDVKMSPYADNQSPIYRYVARFERTFDWNDIF